MEGGATWAAGLAVPGAVLGSFLATAAVRWPQGRSVMEGRSACDGCGRALRPWELVPLLSALALRGRCASCGARIDPAHPLVEAGGAAVGLVAGSVAGGWPAVAGACFGWLLLLLAALDLRALWLPDRVTGLLAAGGLVAGVPALGERLVGGAAGFASLWLVAAAYRRVRGREGMGGGDPKLMGAVGLWLGWRVLPAVVTAAALIGLGAVLALRVLGRRVDGETPLPFGVLLAAAAFGAWAVMVGAGA